MYVNKMNKIGDSYLPCIAMAHSPQVKFLVYEDFKTHSYSKYYSPIVINETQYVDILNRF
jgi:hypothetical protein